MEASAAAAVAAAAAAHPVSGHGNDTTPQQQHQQHQQPAATMAPGVVTSKRAGGSEGGSMEGLFLHDLGADAAATARKKVSGLRICMGAPTDGDMFQRANTLWRKFTQKSHRQL